MGNIASVVMVAPFPPGPEVAERLRDLGFEAAADGGRPDEQVWLLLDRKLNYYAEQKFGVDGLRDLVLALPWRREVVETHLQVLWEDEYTHADDSWGGRVSPLSWNRETWVVPPR